MNSEKKQKIKEIERMKPESRGINIKDGLKIAKHIEEINPEIIIESGRARGASTEIFAKYFPDKKIISIDFDKHSRDTKYSEKKLKKYKNIKLVYGDSRKIIFNYLKKTSHVFIDGPKGHEAIILAAKLFEEKNVKSISLDDFSEDDFYTTIIENIFTHVTKLKTKDNQNGRAILIDKRKCELNKQTLEKYKTWFDKIRPFYTKYTYKLKPRTIKKTIEAIIRKK